MATASARLTRGLEWLAALFLFVMMVLTFVDVIGRYFFNAPIYGAAEMIQFLLAAMIFSALGLVSLTGGHLGVDLIAPALERKFPRVQPALVGLVSVAGLLLIGVQLGRSGLEALRTDRVTIVLEWPIAAVTLPSAAFCLLAAALQAAVTLQAVRSHA